MNQAYWHPGGFPIPDNAFLPEVSLQTKLPCDGHKNERWVHGVICNRFLSLGASGPARTDRKAEYRLAGNVPGPSTSRDGSSKIIRGATALCSGVLCFLGVRDEAPERGRANRRGLTGLTANLRQTVFGKHCRVRIATSGTFPIQQHMPLPPDIISDLAPTGVLRGDQSVELSVGYKSKFDRGS